jgi:hypothetical protein
VLAVKDNQPTPHDEARLFLDTNIAQPDPDGAPHFHEERRSWTDRSPGMRKPDHDLKAQPEAA